MAHPYHPPSISIPHYVPNHHPLTHSLSLFAGLVTAIIASVWIIATRRRLRGLDRFSAVWFALCGFLHVFFEGYYVLHLDNLPSLNTLFAQVWKEYALSDSRYLTSDVFTLCVETITVLAWGPLSLLTLYLTLTNGPSRHLFRAVVCTAHLYGVALYYATAWAESRLHGVGHSRPEALYYWVYYVGFNAPWAVVPLLLLGDSCREITAAFTALEGSDARRKRA